MAEVIIENISKMYGDNYAVKDFSVHVDDGEFITFLGPSGCGKTTTLRLVAGFIKPTKGSISIGTRIVTDSLSSTFIPPEERGVGMVFQSYAVWPHMNVFKNVAYPLKIKKYEASDIKLQVQKALELTRMPELADRYPHQLSGGQQQRVALARALVMDPDVLLLDEPLSNLDAKLREEMRFELKELQKKTKVTIIFVTHDQLEAMVLSDRVVVMDQGEIQQIGTPKQIYRNPSNRFVADFIGVANLIKCHIGSDRVPHYAGRSECVLPVRLPDELPTNTDIILMVRPEDVELISEPDSIYQIDKKIYMGDAMEYIVMVGDFPLRVKTSSEVDLSINTPVSLKLDNFRHFTL